VILLQQCLNQRKYVTFTALFCDKEEDAVVLDFHGVNCVLVKYTSATSKVAEQYRTGSGYLFMVTTDAKDL